MSSYTAIQKAIKTLNLMVDYHKAIIDIEKGDMKDYHSTRYAAIIECIDLINSYLAENEEDTIESFDSMFGTD